LAFKGYHASGSRTLEVLLNILVRQFHAGRVWCSFRYDAEGIFDEQGGRTDTGESFELQGEALRKLIEQACDNQQFLLLSDAKHNAGRVQAQSVIIVPIATDEGTLGVIYIRSKPDRAPFTMSDLDYAMLLSINLGIILENF
jgi:GAF domain-containing protein